MNVFFSIPFFFSPFSISKAHLSLLQDPGPTTSISIFSAFLLMLFVTTLKIARSLKDKYSCFLGAIILLCNNPVTLLIRAPDKRGY